jgi:hypothetical protein
MGDNCEAELRLDASFEASHRFRAPFFAARSRTALTQVLRQADGPQPGRNGSRRPLPATSRRGPQPTPRA